jgi:hypothetical protein
MKNLFFCLLLFLCFQGQAQNLKTTIDNTILDQGNRGITAIKLRNNLHLIVDSLRGKTQLPVNNNTERAYLVEDYGITGGNRNGQIPIITRIKSWITVSQLKNDINAKPTIGYFQNVDPLNPNFYSGYDYVYSTSEKLLYKFVAGSGFLQDRVDQVAENIITESGAIDKLLQKQINSKQDGLSGTGFVKSTAGAISYDNSTYLSTSSASSTYLPISNPSVTGTLTAPTISNSLGANFATSSGNVGIGTTSPSEKLNVTGNILASGTVLGSNLSGTNTGDNATNTQYSGLATSKQDALNGTGFIKASGTTISYDNSTYLTTSSASSTYLPIANPTLTGTLTAPIIANTLGANFATTIGNVGIGTTSPNSVLHTVGTIQTSSTSSASSNYANRFNNIIFSRFDVPTTFTNAISNSWSGTSSDQTMNFEIGNGSSTRVTAMTLLGNGNVGIGVTAPAYKLDVNGTFNSNSIYTKDNQSGFAGNHGRYSVAYPYATFSTSGAWGYDWQINGSSKMMMFSNGNIGVNTTTDLGYKLNVNGTANITGMANLGSTYVLNNTINVANDNDTDGNEMYLNYFGYNAGNTRFRNTVIANGKGVPVIYTIGSSGNVNIGRGNNFDSGYKLDVLGTIQSSQFKLNSLNTAPASSSATGTVGEIRIDANYIYICVNTNTWKRSAITNW